MKGFPRRLVDAVCRLLSDDIAAAAAGDLEEQWRARMRTSPARAWLRLAADVGSLIHCAWCSRRADSSARRYTASARSN